MNQVTLIGRLTKNPEIRVTTDGKTTTARFSLAVDRGKKDGKDLGADFISIVAFNKTADLCEKYLTKGKQIAIQGKLQTGSYEKDGVKHYTTDVVVDRLEFLDSNADVDSTKDASSVNEKPSADDIPAVFQKIDDDDIPF